MESACQNNEIEKAFIGYVYHRNVSIIYVPCAKCITTAISGEASTGIQYIMMLKNPPHIDIAINLAGSRSYISPNNLQHFLLAFNIYCFLNFKYYSNRKLLRGLECRSKAFHVKCSITEPISSPLQTWSREMLYILPLSIMRLRFFHEWLANQTQDKFKMKSNWIIAKYCRQKSMEHAS